METITITKLPAGIEVPSFAKQSILGIVVQARKYKNRYFVSIDSFLEKVRKDHLSFWSHLKAIKNKKGKPISMLVF